MSRSVIHTWRSQPLAMEELPDIPLNSDLDDVYAEDDPSTISLPVTHECLIAQQCVVYSATFGVPTFYFKIHDSSLLFYSRILGTI